MPEVAARTPASGTKFSETRMLATGTRTRPTTALEEIAGALAQDKIAITYQERGDMLTLAARMKMDDLVPHALGFCPQAR